MQLEKNPQAEERNFYILAILGGLVSVVGLAAALHMEHYGHVVTGMNNQVVWGLPHVFAIFLIVAASGVLNVASIGSVFGKVMYKPRAPLSGLLALAMLAAGLAVIMLDLGRADRLVVAMTHFNPTSVFGWNVILYPGFFAIVGIYLWTLMDRKMNPYYKSAGLAAFIWRLLLTTGTGSIFGFLVARQAYQSAVIAPMFIIMSFAWGLAVFMIVQKTMFAWNGMTLHAEIRQRMKNLLGTFVAAVFYFVFVYHLTNLYFAKQTAFEQFILLSGGIFPALFWGGWLFVGTILPLLFLYTDLQKIRGSVFMAASLVIVGAFCLLYVFIIGGQVYPLEIFPGMEATSSFYDGKVDSYAPHWPEILLAFGGIGIAFTMVTVGVRVLKFLPQDDISKLKSADGHLLD
ncbi:MAG: NrfD/PsrC family molybdoenzyme membrane anchor subunit [Rhodocyclaceae bacterium]|jgi:molybdopterin-containing oxidoreductase family membrane subunit|nr:NrfD/PsrC family molybdoenzyme membrane anchor subunit [Rhodocyclaceae bacterium]